MLEEVLKIYYPTLQSKKDSFLNDLAYSTITGFSLSFSLYLSRDIATSLGINSLFYPIIIAMPIILIYTSTSLKHIVKQEEELQRQYTESFYMRKMDSILRAAERGSFDTFYGNFENLNTLREFERRDLERHRHQSLEKFFYSSSVNYDHNKKRMEELDFYKEILKAASRGRHFAFINRINIVYPRLNLAHYDIFAEHQELLGISPRLWDMHWKEFQRNVLGITEPKQKVKKDVDVANGQRTNEEKDYNLSLIKGMLAHYCKTLNHYPQLAEYLLRKVAVPVVKGEKEIRQIVESDSFIKGKIGNDTDKDELISDLVEINRYANTNHQKLQLHGTEKYTQEKIAKQVYKAACSMVLENQPDRDNSLDK